MLLAKTFLASPHKCHGFILCKGLWQTLLIWLANVCMTLQVDSIIHDRKRNEDKQVSSCLHAERNIGPGKLIIGFLL